MLEWLLRGLGGRRVTTAYPDGDEPAPPGFQGPVAVRNAPGGSPRLAAVCPTGAIAVNDDGRVTVDRGRCIHCGACVRHDPGRFAFLDRYETAARSREALVVGGGEPHADAPHVRRALGDQVRALRRSIHLRHVDAGSDGAEEWELQALFNPYYDVQRLGLFLTASPRHADVLLVTGAVTAPMRDPLERAHDVMPAPKAVVALGTDACSGGLGGIDVAGGVDQVLPVDAYVPGSPPAPIAILHGILLAVGVLREQTA